MKILVLNREAAVKLQPKEDVAFISISSAIVKYKDEVPDTGWLGFLPLKFDDVTEQIDDYKVFDMEMARKTLSFLREHLPMEYIVHCDAGVSRSVAVGAFMRDFYGYELELTAIHTDEFRNIAVYNALRRLWMADKEEMENIIKMADERLESQK